MQQDLLTRGHPIIGTVHTQVHQGLVFIATDYDADVDIAAPKYWQIKTASGVFPHVKIQLAVSGAGRVQFFENPTLNADGTELTERNLNRNVSDAAQTTVYFDPNVAADGTEIADEYIPGGGRLQTRIGSMARMNSEWVLKDDEDYLIKFTPDADNTIVAIEVEWYEVGDAVP